MIESIHAFQRLDSRGNPTVQVVLTTENGRFTALVPSGASKGAYEAIELRDGDPAAYAGKGVLRAVRNVEDVLAPALLSHQFAETDLRGVDAFMKSLDGTEDKSKLGANAILGVSMACARAGAAAQRVPLYEFLRRQAGAKTPFVMPVPFFNVLNGGVHSGNAMAFQEFMIAPVGAASMEEAVRMGAEVYQQLKGIIQAEYGSAAIGLGDEGGFAPPISQPHEALDLLVAAVEKCGYTGKVKFAMDPASSEFFQTGKYVLDFKAKDAGKAVLSPEKLAELYNGLIEKYPVILLEDPFAQDDWGAWEAFDKTCKIELVGDDLLATNTGRITMASEKKACNSLLLKINQIGTITEAIEAANMAYSLGWSVFVSHRSGETTDDFIADLAVALRTGHLKSGAPCRGERVAKYNRLMDIEAEIKHSREGCKYAGEGFRDIQKTPA
jgi:enolase